MTAPGSDGSLPVDVLRCLGGEAVFDPATDRDLRDVANRVSAAVLLEEARRAPSASQLVTTLADLLLVDAYSGIQLLRFTDGNDSEDDSTDEIGVEDDLDDARRAVPRHARTEAFYRIRFADPDAARCLADYLRPRTDRAIEYAVARSSRCHFWQVSVAYESDLEDIVADVRDAPLVSAVEPIDAESFWQRRDA